jgi:hypothetical protein
MKLPTSERPDPPIPTMSKSEPFTQACRINGLRKEAQLPLRNIRQMIAAEEDRVAWTEYGLAADKHRAVYDHLREAVRQEYINAGKGDIAMSAGGRWLFNWKAMKLFEEFLGGNGHFRPVLNGMSYGKTDA